MSKADHRSIAETLLEEGFLLSALEFHTEILERGLPPEPHLKTFFENPSNFEESSAAGTVLSPSLDRCASQATLDDSSLWGGISTEDSRQEAENKLAVLEFELRKARESIATLKEELASKDNSSLQSHPTDSNNHVEERGISSRELTLLNHLINDYLLENNYKLTSITFSDENADMDFEEWEDSLYNKPPNLLNLFRDYYLKGPANHILREEEGLFSQQGTQTTSEEKPDLSPVVDTLDAYMQTEEERSSREEVEALKETIEYQNATIESLNERLSSPGPKENGSAADDERQWEDDSVLQGIFNHDIYVHFCNKIGFSQYDSNSSRYEESEEDLVFLLGHSLPKIVPNVLLAKREDLIPVILSVIQRHTDFKVRDHLLSILFNLIKKPDASQRQMIIEGYVSLARKFGPSRLESELLPHCWEQIDHKYPSRRTLVAETCITLMPFIPPSIRNSLVLSMLQQLALEDKDSNVRIAAIKGVSSLLLFLTEVDKFNVIWRLNTQCLQDSDELIIRNTQDSLLPLAGSWCLSNLGESAGTTLGSEPIKDLLRNVVNIHDEASSFWKGVYFKVKTVHLLMPMVVAFVFMSLPPEEALELSEEEPFSISLSRKQVAVIREELISGGRCDSPKFAWFSSNIIEGIVRVSAQIPVNPSTEGIVELLVIIIKDISRYIGSSLVEDILKPTFGSYFRPDLPLTSPLYSSSLLPLFLLGLSSNIINDLKQWISFYARKSLNSSSIDFVVNEVLRSRPDLRNDFMDMNWEFLVNEDPLFRSKAGHYMNEILLKADLDYEYFNVKLLPGIVTLASDPDTSVKCSAIAGLGSAAVHDLTVSNPELSEKVLLQFISLMEDQRDEESLEKFIHHLGFIIPISSQKLRDQILLNKLGELTSIVVLERLYACIETTLESHRNILTNLVLPKSILRSHILPSLRNLSEILLEQSQKDSLSHMLKSVEFMAQESESSPSPVHQTDKLPSSPSMEEVKQRMGKLFAKSNWKK